MNTKWQGGNMEMGPGGGQKINMLRNELINWTEQQLRTKIILFTDSYDVIALTSPTEILTKYNSICHNETVLFTAEKSCWLLQQLDIFYPETDSDYKYLNSGGFIGNAGKILNLLEKKIENFEDDQLYYTKIFLFDNKIDHCMNKIKLEIKSLNKDTLFQYKNFLLETLTLQNIKFSYFFLPTKKKNNCIIS